MKNKFTILGCGSSLGSPWITNYSGKLKKNSKNFRTRCCAHIQKGNLSILIDTSPDIKNQFLKNKIKASTKLIDGKPVNSIVDYAKDNSIVILGVSPKNPIMKYFFGSKPLSIAQKCNCPVLITK